MAIQNYQEYQYVLKGKFIFQGARLNISKFFTRESWFYQNSLLEGKKLYLGEIPPNLTTKFLTKFLQKYGSIDEVYIRKDSDNRSLYAFATFKHYKNAKALSSIGSLELPGWGYIRIDEYTTTAKKANNKNEAE